MTQPDVPSILECGRQFKLSLGDPVFIKQDGLPVPHILSVFLIFDGNCEGPILTCTGGYAKKGDDVYLLESMHENWFLGTVTFYCKGVVIIELCAQGREQVCNLLQCSSFETYIPIIYEGPIHSLLNTDALCNTESDHSLEGRITGIDTARNQVYFRTKQRHQVNEISLGRLLTSSRDSAREARMLPAYGPVCGKALVNYEQTAFVALIHPAIKAFQAYDKRFEGKKASFLVPVTQPSDTQPEQGKDMSADTEGLSEATGGVDNASTPESEASGNGMTSNSKCSLSSTDVEIDGCYTTDDSFEGKDSGCPDTVNK